MHPIFSRLSRPIALAAAVVAIAPAAWAHHSFAMFDTTQTLTVEGTVKELQWSSPHTWLEVMAKDQTGAEKQLSLELNGISGLRQVGWTPTTLKPGDKVSLTYHPMRDGTPAGELMTLVTGDGRTLKGR